MELILHEKYLRNTNMRTNKKHRCWSLTSEDSLFNWYSEGNIFFKHQGNSNVYLHTITPGVTEEIRICLWVMKGILIDSLSGESLPTFQVGVGGSRCSFWSFKDIELHIKILENIQSEYSIICISLPLIIGTLGRVQPVSPQFVKWG